MKDRGEKRLYVVVAGSVDTNKGKIIQPPGRQIAQACHAVEYYRYEASKSARPYEIMTKIILQARDSSELDHVLYLLRKKKIETFLFHDDNPEYGVGIYPTAFCTEPVYKDQVVGILDYLPLWSGR
jgi:hypothetical protein